MTKTAIVLSAGHAARFNGVLKELLPIDDNRVVLDTSIDAARVWKADRIVIVSNPDKVAQHVKHFQQDKYSDLNIVFKNNSAGEMWDSLCKGLEESTELNLMLMADTVFNYHTLHTTPNAPLSFGTFPTTAPGNYSVFVDGKIVTKDKNLNLAEVTFKAWGCVIFNHAVAGHWKYHQFTHYDEAFNSGIQNYCNVEYFSIAPYYDIGILSRYVKYLSKEYV